MFVQDDGTVFITSRYALDKHLAAIKKNGFILLKEMPFKMDMTYYPASPVVMEDIANAVPGEKKVYDKKLKETIKQTEQNKDKGVWSDNNDKAIQPQGKEEQGDKTE